MPGLLKIGKTTRDPTSRLSELSAHTGVPTAFVLLYSQPVDDCDAAERVAHLELERKGYRPNHGREFFSAPPHEAVQAVITGSRARSADFDASPDAVPAFGEGISAAASELFDLAEQYNAGTTTVLRNHSKALRLYEQAAALGHGDAAHAAAGMYYYGADGVKSDTHKALELYNRAVSLGSWTSLAPIASLFGWEGQRESAEYHWRLFFKRANDAVKQSVAAGDTSRALDLEGAVGIYGIWYFESLGSGEIGNVVPDELLRPFATKINAFTENALSKHLSDSGSEWKVTRLKHALRFIKRLMGAPSD